MMRSVSGVLTVVLFGSVLAVPAFAGSPKVEAGKATIAPDRLAGLKAAVADIEAGKLKLKVPPLPAPPWHLMYTDLLKRECGLDWESVDNSTEKVRIELQGYNDVMIMELEHRFGKGILETLQKKAEANYRKSLNRK